MHDSLAPLLADGVIEEVVARLKSGKEADLWIVRHGGALVAAKVYKAREARNFKNDAGYREGRQVRDTRMQRAMQKKTRFGQAAAEEAWKAKEADALYQLHAAGVRVPTPVMFYEGVLLMELVVDAGGHPAPRLIDAGVTPESAAALYADLRAQATRMLCADLIHGDLSPYNVLVGHAGPVVIDFPQVVGAAHNSQAERYFRRDLENLQHFFAGFDPELRARVSDAREIWRAYVRRELTPEFEPSGRIEPERAPQHAGHRGGGQHVQRGGGHPGQRAEHGGHRPEQHREQPGQRGEQHARGGGRGDDAGQHGPSRASGGEHRGPRGAPAGSERPGHRGEQRASGGGHPAERGEHARRPGEQHRERSGPRGEQQPRGGGPPGRERGDRDHGPHEHREAGGQGGPHGHGRPPHAGGAPQQGGRGPQSARPQQGPGPQHPGRPPQGPAPQHAGRPQQGARPQGPGAPQGSRPPGDRRQGGASRPTVEVVRVTRLVGPAPQHQGPRGPQGGHGQQGSQGEHRNQGPHHRGRHGGRR